MNSLPPSAKTTDSRPLSGRRIVVTRPRACAREMADALAALGAEVVLVPVIRIAAAPSRAFEAALVHAAANTPTTLVVFTSTNAVEQFAAGCERAGVSVLAFTGSVVAAVGPATAQASAAIGLEPGLVPSVHTAEALVDALEASPLDLARMCVLYPRARDAAGVIEARLGPLVASVEAHVVYGAEVESPSPPFQAPPHVVTFASSSAASAFEQVVPEGDAALVKRGIPIACIGPATAQTARDRGYENVHTAPEHTSRGLIEMVITLVSTKGTP